MPIDPFVVSVARLRRVPGTRSDEARTGPIEAIDESGPPSPVDSRVPPAADVSCTVTLVSYAGGITVAGTVEAPWQGLCRRCANPVGGTVRAEVKERFTETAAVGAGNEGVDDAYPIVEDRLDLGPMIRDALFLELPRIPLCRPDCAGLCPTCGADRNEERCDCVPLRDLRWANLDVLRSAPVEDRLVEHAREGI